MTEPEPKVTPESEPRPELRVVQIGELYEQHTPMLSGLLYKFGFPKQDIPDIIQETYYRVIKYIDNYREEADIRTYIGRMAINTGRTLRDKNYRKNEQPVDEKYEPYFDRIPSLIPSPESEVIEHIVSQEKRAKLYDAIGRLSARLRDVVILKLEGYSHQDISERLGITVSASKVRLHRATAKLAEMVDEQRSDS
jgi:RNA polymerase sigma-70 factor (ECF subfamily)